MMQHRLMMIRRSGGLGRGRKCETVRSYLFLTIFNAVEEKITVVGPFSAMRW